MDEFAFVLDESGDAFYVLQDANYNVMGLVDAAGEVVEQCVYGPYGELVPVHADNPADPLARMGHQGLFFVRLDGWADDPAMEAGAVGLYYNRNRWYSPHLGRFIQRDVNETALPIITVLAFNAQTLDSLLSAFDAQALFGDGFNLYAYSSSTDGGIGVHGVAVNRHAYGVWGENNATTGNAIGVYGTTSSPAGFGGWFDGKGYFSGDVGIGTTNPGSPLTVAGLIESTSGGFKFPDGTTQTTAATGGDSFWQEATNGIYYPDGNVGFGLVTNPSSPVHATGNQSAAVISARNTYAGPGGNAITAETGATDGYAVFGRNNATTGGSHGLYGIAYSPDANGVRGRNLSTTGAAIGVYGASSSTAGTAVHGYASASSGTTYGVYGEVNSPDGFAGYFDGKGYFSGNVGIGTTSPGYPLHVYAGVDAAIAAENPGENTSGELGSSYGGVFGESTTGIGVYGQATAETGTNYGVRGDCASPDGYAGYFNGRGYFSGNVGIGTNSPGSPLTVAGAIESTADGFKFPDGTVQATAASGSGSQWEGAGGGSDIYYLGQVGIGTTNPQFQLQVESSDSATIRVKNTSTYGEFCGVLAEVDSPDGRAVKGYAGSLTGDAAGVFGQSASPDGYGVSGRNLEGGYGVYGEGDAADGGWAGYFYGRGYFSGDVGIGQASPQAKLDVNGTVKMNGFRLGASSTSGYVLTCNSNGVGTWQEPTGGGGSFDLPYEGTVDAHDQAAFSITNTAPGSGSDPGTDTVAGLFESAALGGSAVKAYTTGGIARSVHAEADGSVGIAVYAAANGGNGRAVAANNNSAQPTVEASNSGTGDIFQGRHGGSTVFRVTYDGTTITNVLQIEGGADLSEQFDVQAAQAEPEPGLVVCIDPANPGKLIVSTQAYDRKVAGIVSGAGGVKPGMLMGQNDSVADGRHPVALTGRVYVRADASNGPIEPGDLLTTSDVPGHAMKVTDHGKAQGAIIGKAMTPLPSGDGLVLVLVTLQ